MAYVTVFSRATSFPTKLKALFHFNSCSLMMKNFMANSGDEIKEESLVRIPSSSWWITYSTHTPQKPQRLEGFGTSDQEGRQESKTTPSCHTFFKFFIPPLLAVVAFKYQGKSEDPSKTHPLQTWSFIIAIFMYSLVLFAMKRSQNQSAKLLQFLGLAALASGLVSSLSLLSLLLPHFPGLILLLTSWALFVLVSVFPILKSICNWLVTGIKPYLDVLICRARNLFKGWNSGHQQPPQVTGQA